MTRAGITAVAAHVILLACERPTYADGVNRVPSEATWDTVLAVSSGVADTMFVRPRLLTANARGLYVYDYGPHTVKAFDHSGALLWTHGRQGSGPGEFRNALAIEPAPDGSVWVLDGGASRIAILDPHGTERSLIPLRARALPQRLVMLDSVTYVLLLAPDDGFFGRLEPSGEVHDVIAYPSDTLAAVDPNLRIVVAGSNGSEWAGVFVFGDRFLVYGRRLVCTGLLREGKTFGSGERATGNESEIAAGVIVGEDALWVLGIPRADRNVRFLDEYDLRSCNYRSSHRLPVRARTVAYHAGTFYVQHEEPIPEILGLRLR